MKDFYKNLKFSWYYTKEEKLKVILLVIFNVINIVISVIAPILSAWAIIALTSDNYKQIILIAILILGIEVLGELFNYLTRVLALRIQKKAKYRLQMDVGANILKLENSCLDEKGSGVFIQRLTNDTGRISEAFDYILNMVGGIVRYIGILIAILVVNRIVFIYIFITLIISYVLEKLRTDRRNEDDKESRRAFEKVTGLLGELVRGARDIKMLNSEDDFLKELDVKITDHTEKRSNMRITSWRYSLLTDSIMCIFSFCLIILLVSLMEKKIITASIALVLYNYSRNVSYSFYSVGSLLEYIKDFNLSSERVFDIIHSDEFKKEEFGNKHIDKVNGDFEFKNVSFGYNDKRILKNISFKIHANETVAFVGKSGAGKTTIFNLLCKMYDIDKGVITIDGVDIKELDKDSIRGNITIISQNPYIFNMSIRDNLRLVKSDLTDKEMKDACRIACLEEFIKELPDKYDTIIGEGGVNLSGGQKQRLAIARALVQKTEIILFDEATSALDNETQERISDAIHNMRGEYTILIIAHRLSTIINSDRILYLEGGKIIAEGSHQELLKSCPSYKELYESEIIDE